MGKNVWQKVFLSKGPLCSVVSWLTLEKCWSRRGSWSRIWVHIRSLIKTIIPVCLTLIWIELSPAKGVLITGLDIWSWIPPSRDWSVVDWSCRQALPRMWLDGLGSREVWIHREVWERFRKENRIQRDWLTGAGIRSLKKMIICFENRDKTV